MSPAHLLGQLLPNSKLLQRQLPLFALPQVEELKENLQNHGRLEGRRGGSSSLLCPNSEEKGTLSSLEIQDLVVARDTQKDANGRAHFWGSCCRRTPTRTSWPPPQTLILPTTQDCPGGPTWDICTQLAWLREWGEAASPAAAHQPLPPPRPPCEADLGQELEGRRRRPSGHSHRNAETAGTQP